MGDPIYANSSALAILLTIVSIAIGFLIYLPGFWSIKRFVMGLNAVLIGLSTGVLVTTRWWAIGVIIGVLQCYRIFHALRIVQGRAPKEQLRDRAIRSEIVLSAFLVAILVFDSYIRPYIHENLALTLIVILQLMSAIVYYQHLKHMLQKTKLRIPRKHIADTDVPTLTVAIPARNETDELSDCLQSILASNYPKLEVLVVDDCSQDKTSDIIRGFAHRGVRFVEGISPPKGWVAKNFAYDQLLSNASGQYILFCGTDVRFDQTAVKTLMESVISNKLSMCSVLPKRSHIFDKQFLLQPMRYWRELVMPHFDKSPSSLSTCWVADRKMLLKHGGFEGVRKAVRPEKIIARGVAAKGRYAFIRTSAGLEISSVKTLRAQWNTAIRTRYPELHNRPEAVWISSIWELFILFGPAASLVWALLINQLLLALCALISMIILLLINYRVYYVTTGVRSLRPVIMYPLNVLLEIVVLNYSMWSYEFSEVIWKGRNVCLPVLQISPTLPKLSSRD